MRTNILITACLGVCLSSCTGSPSQKSTGTASSGADVGTFNGEVSILSQDECDRQAGRGITSNNCDAEFDKLVREIEADQDDGG